MDFLKFLFSKVFLKNLLIAIGIGIIILIISLIWLRIYTHHGQALTVPDLTGLNQKEVQIVTSSKKLRFMVTDSIFYRDLPKGTVVKQNPEPGFRVKEFRTIYLTLNAVNPEKITMPEITGVSLRQARAILEANNLSLGKISYRPDIAVNNVLQQMFEGNVIESGRMIVKGSSIDLILGMGLSNESTLVPDMIGKNLRMAKNLLADRYLNIGATIYDNSVLTQEDSVFAIIWRQKPGVEESKRLQLGSNVDIWLTIDSLKVKRPDSLYIDQTGF